MSDVLAEVSEAFHTAQSTFEVKLVAAGSQVLRLQIEQGAKADLFVSANKFHLDALASAGHVAHSEALAFNSLAVAVPPGNPQGLNRFSELPKAARIVIGHASVPLGAYTRQLFSRLERSGRSELRAQIASRVVSEESNARLVRAKVALGEADAAIVYRTDIGFGAPVGALEIPPEFNVTPTYYLASLKEAPSTAGARAFREFLKGPQGRDVFIRRGFELP